MKKFTALVTNKKGKTGNEQENDHSDIPRVLHNAYKKLVQFFHTYSLT